MITIKTLKKRLAQFNTFETKLATYYDSNRRKYISGFIKSNEHGTCVYVNTASCYNPHCGNRVLVRYAKDYGDYKGGTNRFCLEDNLAWVINDMLTKEHWYICEFERGTK